MLSSSSSLSNTPRPYSPLMDPTASDVVYTSRLDKGKGRAVDFDPEEVEQEHGHVYPPLNDEEEEERRIQQTLAMYASKDMAVRKAKRESKMLASATASGTAKRTSWFGFLQIGASKDRERPDQGLPFHTQSPNHSRSSSRAGGVQDQQTYPYPTPYDPPVNPFQPLITSREPQAQQGRARADSNATITGNSPFGDEHAAASAEGPLPSEQEYGYRGPDWRGGQPSSGQSQPPAVRPTGPEKWWHALCAWGDDLDQGGRDGQAGRTNPFE